MGHAFSAFILTLCLSITASPKFAQSSPPDYGRYSIYQVQGLSVFGCELVLDANKMSRCLDDKIDDMVRDATRNLNRKITDLNGTIENIGRTPIMGCRITPDIRQSADCIQDKVDRQIEHKVKLAEARLNASIKVLDRQKGALEQQVADLQKNNPLGPVAGKFQKDLQALAAMGQMNLESINACLTAASSAQRDMVQLTQRFVSNPPAFPPYLINDVWRQMEANFDVIMEEEMAGLRAAAASGRLPQVDQVLDRAVQALKKLAERDPSARCVYAAMEPHVPAMRQAAKAMQQQIYDKVMNLAQTKVLPAILDPVGQQLGQVFGQIMQSDMTGNSLGALLPNQKELDRIIRGVAAEQLIRPSHIRAATDRVQALSKTLGTPEEQASFERLRRVLQREEVWPEIVAIQVAMEILRFSGHKWIDSDMPGAGAFVANLAVSTIGTSKDTVGNVLEAACGLIPEAGAAVCAIFNQMLEVAFNYAVPIATKVVISTTMHGALDQVINEMTKAYVQNYDPQQVRQQLGPFASVANAFPTRDVVIAFATRDRSIREMQLALFDYNDSILKFADTAVRQ